MWGKRLEDIRPGTVMVYAILLTILGYLRVIFQPLPTYDWTFLGEEYEIFPAIRWILPIIWAAIALVINFLVTEQFTLLKRHSYLGFLWGIIMLTVGDFRFALYSLMALIWFLSVLRVQKSNRPIADFLDTGLLVGVYALLDLRFGLLLVASWFILLTFARLRWRAIFGGIWGVVTIHLLFAIAYLVFGKIDVYRTYIESWPSLELQIPDKTNAVWISMVAFFWLLSLGNYITALSRANIVKRQSLSAILILQLALIALVGFGLWPTRMYLAFLPLGTLIFIVNDLQYRKKFWWRDTVFWIFILAFGLSFFEGA